MQGVRLHYALLLLGILITGCREGRAVKEYTPVETNARESLVAVLEQWKRGETGEIASTPAICVADSHRKKGQKLTAYEIVGELPIDNGHRYQVNLTLDQPKAEEKVQYVVVGIDPLWIFRQEDFDMMSHWEHPPTSK